MYVPPYQICDGWKDCERGEDEKMNLNSEKRRTFMRAVRDKEGNLVGYYERFEPPDGYTVSD